jgi:hypothetical protein
MYIENVKIQIFSEYTIQAKDKKSEPSKHRDKIGQVDINWGMEAFGLELIIEAIEEAWHQDPIVCEVSFNKSNL